MRKNSVSSLLCGMQSQFDNMAYCLTTWKPDPHSWQSSYYQIYFQYSSSYLYHPYCSPAIVSASTISRPILCIYTLTPIPVTYSHNRSIILISTFWPTISLPTSRDILIILSFTRPIRPYSATVPPPANTLQIFPSFIVTSCIFMLLSSLSYFVGVCLFCST